MEETPTIHIIRLFLFFIDCVSLGVRLLKLCLLFNEIRFLRLQTVAVVLRNMKLTPERILVVGV